MPKDNLRQDVADAASDVRDPYRELAFAVLASAIKDLSLPEITSPLKHRRDATLRDKADAVAFFTDASWTAWGRSREFWAMAAGIDPDVLVERLHMKGLLPEKEPAKAKAQRLPMVRVKKAPQPKLPMIRRTPLEPANPGPTPAQQRLLDDLPKAFVTDRLPPRLRKRWTNHRQRMIDAGLAKAYRSKKDRFVRYVVKCSA